MSNEMETLNTLRYANRAQNIENVPLMKSDSRENIVLKLKRELRKLKEENYSLKMQLGYINGSAAAKTSPHPVNLSGSSSNSSGRLPKINSNRNGSSNSTTSSDSDLYGMLQEYIQENKTLKNENSQLEKFREKIRKEHEVLTRENEKLARKLDQLIRTQGGDLDPSAKMTMAALAASKTNGTTGAAKPLPQIEKRTKFGQSPPVDHSNSSPVVVRRGQQAAGGQVVIVSSGSSGGGSVGGGPKKIHKSQSGSNLSDPGDMSHSVE